MRREQTSTEIGRNWLLIAALSLLIAACSEHQDLREELSISRGLNADPESLHPHLHSSNEAATILRDIGEGLLTYDAKGSLVGGAASSWSVSPDGLVLTFTIRDGLSWHDGKPIDAETFEASLIALVSPQTGSPHAYLLEPVVNGKEILNRQMAPNELGVEALDETTLQINLTSASPFFLQVLAHPSTFPTRVVQGASVDDDGEQNKSSFFSNGAYYVDEYVLGHHWVLRKNLNYWDAANTKIERVTYHIVDQEVEPLRFEAGELDITDNVSEDAFSRYARQNSDELRVAPMLGVYFLGFSLRSDSLVTNQQFREALYLAVDRKTLVEKVLGRGEIAAFTFVPPGVDNYSDTKMPVAEMSQYKRERLARGLLREAGIDATKSISMTVLYNTGGGHQKILLAIQEMWRQVLGIDVDLRGEEFRVFLSNVKNGNSADIFRLSWTGDFNDPVAFLQIFETNSGSNLTGYSNASVDEILHRSTLVRDQAIRAQMLSEAELIVLSDFPVIPLYYYVSKHLVSSRILGWEPNVLDVHLSQHLRVTAPDR